MSKNDNALFLVSALRNAALSLYDTSDRSALTSFANDFAHRESAEAPAPGRGATPRSGSGVGCMVVAATRASSLGFADEAKLKTTSLRSSPTVRFQHLIVSPFN
jgi:hypothetical protein